MSDPLAEIIAMLNLRAVLTKTIEGRRMARHSLGPGHVVLWRGAGRRLSAGNRPASAADPARRGFYVDPGGVPLRANQPDPPPSPALETTPVKLAEEHFRLGALDQPAEMLALIGHCAADSDNASLLTSLLPALVVVRDQPRLATFVGLLKEEAQADRAGKSFVLARMVELLFIEAIRSCETLATPGLVRGLSDPRIAQAIRLLHEAPPDAGPSTPWPPTARCLARRCLNALPA